MTAGCHRRTAASKPPLTGTEFRSETGVRNVKRGAEDAGENASKPQLQKTRSCLRESSVRGEKTDRHRERGRERERRGRWMEGKENKHNARIAESNSQRNASDEHIHALGLLGGCKQ